MIAESHRARSGAIETRRNDPEAAPGLRNWLSVFHPAELMVLLGLLGFGSLLVIAVPTGAGWDEETHVIRAWEMAFLEFIPNANTRQERPFPKIYWDLSYRRQTIVRPVEDGFWSEYGNEPIDARGYIYDQLRTRSVYSPALLLPQAAAFRYLGLREGLPALTVYYGARFLGLFGYALLAWLAVKLVPYGKWTMALIVLVPTGLFQASTISADPISNGIGFVFVAGTLALARRGALGLRSVGILLFLMALLFLAKVHMAVLALLPFFAVPRRRFKPPWGYFLLVLGTIILGILLVGGWAIIGYQGLGVVQEGVDPVGQASEVLRQPVRFLSILAADFGSHGVAYMQQFIAEYGYEYWVVPLPVYVLFAAALVACLIADQKGGTPGRRVRIGLLVVGTLGVLGTAVSLYAAVNPVGSATIFGIQGRYFIAFGPAMFLPLVGLLHPLELRPSSEFWAAGAIAVMLILYSGGALLSYHVVCGTAYYEPGRCYLPVYKNWAPEANYSDPLQDNLKQEFITECGPVEGVRAWLNHPGGDDQEALDMSIHDAATGQRLAGDSVNRANLPQGGWYWLPLPSEPALGAGRELIVLLSPPEGGESDVRVGLTLRDDYPAGRALQGERPLGVDMIFQYGCQSPWTSILEGYPGQ